MDRHQVNPAPPRQRRSMAVLLPAAMAFSLAAASGDPPPPATSTEKARNVFRFDTFGDEAFWTGTLRMNEVIQSAVDPVTALSVGLKVDSEALPPGILE